jgi:hypothetical protein
LCVAVGNFKFESNEIDDLAMSDDISIELQTNNIKQLGILNISLTKMSSLIDMLLYIEVPPKQDTHIVPSLNNAKYPYKSVAKLNNRY